MFDIHQGFKTKYEGVLKMSEKSLLDAVKNCLMRRPKVRMAFGHASNKGAGRSSKVERSLMVR